MGVTRVGADAVAATPNDNSTTVFAIPLPSGGAAGDLWALDVSWTAPGTGTTNTASITGWAPLGSAVDAGTPSCYGGTWVKPWAATDVAVEIVFQIGCNAVATVGLRRSSTAGTSVVAGPSGERAWLAKDATANTSRNTGSITTGGQRVVRSTFADRNGSTYSALTDTATGTTRLPSSSSIGTQETDPVAAGTFQRSATASSSTSIASMGIYTLMEQAPTLARTGGGAAGGAGSGGRTVASTSVTRTGGGAAGSAGSGAKVVTVAATLARSGNQGIQGPDRVRVACRTSGASSVRLAVSTTSSMTSPVYSPAVTPDAQGYAIVTATGLVAGTAYWWQLELDGSLRGDVGLTRTLPTPGAAASFSWVAGACMADTVRPVWDTMRTRTGPYGAPLFFCHLGDEEYVYITANGQPVAPSDAAALRTMHEGALGADKQRQAFRDLPTSYVWSDTDFGGSNSDGTWAGNSVHQGVYRQMYASPVPATAGLYRSWTVGRIRFIHTDHRSFSSARGDADTSSKTLLGATQKQWLKDQWSAAKAAGQAVIWLGDNEWAGAAQSPDGTRDNWRVYTIERTELANYITANSIPILAYIHGDTHQLAASSGSGAPANLPTWCVTPFYGTATATSGSGDGGTHPASGTTGASQFGWFDLADDGSLITVTFRGIDSGGTERVTATRSMTIAPATDRSGGGAAGSAGSGARSRLRSVTGSAATAGSGSGQRQLVRSRAGSAAPGAAGGGARVVSTVAMLTRSGGSAGGVTAAGSRLLDRRRGAGAGLRLAGGGGVLVSSATVVSRAGGAGCGLAAGGSVVVAKSMSKAGGGCVGLCGVGVVVHPGDVVTGPDVGAHQRAGVSLAAMKDYLDKTNDAQDGELAEFLAAGVERVEVHLGRLLAAPTTALERLAVMVATATYWSTQRWRTESAAGSRGSWASGEAIRADSGPGGMAPLEAKLTELLGPAAVVASQDRGGGPVGSFPDPLPYPDPAVVSSRWSW